MKCRTRRLILKSYWKNFQFKKLSSPHISASLREVKAVFAQRRRVADPVFKLAVMFPKTLQAVFQQTPSATYVSITTNTVFTTTIRVVRFGEKPASIVKNKKKKTGSLAHFMPQHLVPFLTSIPDRYRGHIYTSNVSGAESGLICVHLWFLFFG